VHVPGLESTISGRRSSTLPNSAKRRSPHRMRKSVRATSNSGFAFAPKSFLVLAPQRVNLYRGTAGGPLRRDIAVHSFDPG
jgi:hypothetical protein